MVKRQTYRRFYVGSILAGGLLVSSLLGLTLTASWAERSPLPPPRLTQNTPSQAVDARLVTAQNQFGFKLFSQVSAQTPAENVLVSPSSVAIALSMAYNGAGGETQQAMARTLELAGMSLADLNRANATLESVLENADPNVKLAIANSLWGRQDVSFQPEFLQRNQQFYNAEIATLDFADPASVGRINDWVSRNTEGKIPEILDDIDPDEVLFLVNAIYFKGNWTVPFNPRNTSDRPFHLSDGSQKTHPFMSQNGNFAYAETDQFQAIQLPYGNRRFSMMVFLPKPQESLAEFQQTLSTENWAAWKNQFSHQEGSIQLPRFKVEYSTGLNDVLKSMGMEIAFDRDRADFSGMADADLYINRVQHKTFIEVNEAGTEAAAATSIGIAATSLPINPPFQMVVDRPFFYAIQDNQTGAVLFMGSVVEPE